MPGLRDVAYLEIDLDSADGTTHTGVFELREDLTEAGTVDVSYLLSNRGQLLRSAVDIGTDFLPDEVADADLESRRGYHVDGGAGSYSQNLSFKAAKGDEWGDGSTDPANPDDVSRYDATGSDAQAMKHVLEWYVSQARHGSSGGARLYIGEWADGTHASEAGAFDSPMYVGITESSITKDPDEPGTLEITLDMEWTSTFPGVIDETLEDVAEFIQDF